MAKQNSKELEFDVALSFAGEDRTYVQRVAEYLRAEDVSLFYDQFNTVDLWGKNLLVELPLIFSSDRSRMVVVFASENYKKKIWTKSELQSAILSSLKSDREFLLPARFDDVTIPGLSDSIAWVDLRSIKPEKLGAMIVEKLTGVAKSTETEKARQRQPVKASGAKTLKHRLAMKKRIEKDFVEQPSGPHDIRSRRERILGNEMILHDVEDSLYPDADPDRAPSGWMKLEMFDLYFGGIEVILNGSQGLIDGNGNWCTIKYGDEFDTSRFRVITVWAIGRLPYDCIVDYDMDTDDYYHGPHVYCHYWNNGSPWESFRFVYTDEKHSFKDSGYLISFQRIELPVSSYFYGGNKSKLDPKIVTRSIGVGEKLRMNGHEVTAQCAYLAASLYPKRFSSRELTKYLASQFDELHSRKNKGAHNLTTTALMQRGLLKKPLRNQYEWNNEAYPVQDALREITEIINDGYNAKPLQVTDFIKWIKENVK
jgi:hypothetical protein